MFSTSALLRSCPLPSPSHASSHLFLFLWLKAPSWLSGNKTVCRTGPGLITSSLSYLANMFLSQPTAGFSMYLQQWEGKGPPGWMRKGEAGRELWNWCGGAVKIKHLISTPSDLFQLTAELREQSYCYATQQKGLQKKKRALFLSKTAGSTRALWVAASSKPDPYFSCPEVIHKYPALNLDCLYTFQIFFACSELILQWSKYL